MSTEPPIKPPTQSPTTIDTSLSFDEAAKTREFRWENKRLFYGTANQPSTQLVLGCIIVMQLSQFGPRLMTWATGNTSSQLHQISQIFCYFLGFVCLVAFFYFGHKAYGRRRWQVLYNLGYPICPHCGYDVRGQVELRCPECGSTITRPQPLDPKNDPLCDAIKTTKGHLEYMRLFKTKRSLPPFACFIILACLNAIIIEQFKSNSLFIRANELLLFLGNTVLIGLIIILIVALPQYRRGRYCRWQALYNLGFEVCSNCGHDLRSCIDELRQQTEPCCPKCKTAITIRETPTT